MAETKAVAAAVPVEASPVEVGRSRTVAAAVPVEASTVEVEVGRGNTVAAAVETSPVEGRSKTVAAAVELVVLHAKPPTSLAVNMGGPGVPGDVVGLVEEDLRKKAEGVVGKARSLCAANSVEAVVDVVDGEPKHVLCDAVENHRADLLVVGSQGYGAIRRALLGSVSDYCAHHADCSVVIVKQPGSKN
ncbi:Universal stress protein A-like protein [Triticum urartu]|uniref:Universal stress protein A-like protein n=1 Tax=Triticum urartu TaxID=4572 RepID=M7ZUC2_TRIUA|nr:Universal stress protein A-like protein [Triticum urartu]